MKSKAIEIVPNKLYWIADSKPPQSQKEAYYFSIDTELVYQPFYQDFGPLNLGQMHSFCQELGKLFKDEAYKRAKIYHYCSDNFQKKANAAFLMGAFQIIILGRSSLEAWKPFENEKFVHYRDALKGICTYKCTIQHCLEAVEWSLKLGWYNPSTFNLTEYQYYERVENGDLNWVLPGKFVAFSTPVDSGSPADLCFSPDFYVPIFKKMGVTMVVRLNNKEYDREKFVKKGIKHLDNFFTDGTCPPEDKVKKFLETTEAEPGAVAVHCKAGLGRTGTLISLYAMKHYKIPARVMIAWLRICRPGSVLGPQQHYLVEKEAQMHSEHSAIADKLKIHDIAAKLKGLSIGSGEKSKMSELDEAIMAHGDKGQAEGLLGAKKSKTGKKP